MITKGLGGLGLVTAGLAVVGVPVPISAAVPVAVGGGGRFVYKEVEELNQEENVAIVVKEEKKRDESNILAKNIQLFIENIKLKAELDKQRQLKDIEDVLSNINFSTLDVNAQQRERTLLIVSLVVFLGYKLYVNRKKIMRYLRKNI